jgi:dihydroorotate dehydrogenase (NAD+) catalytic subunit
LSRAKVGAGKPLIATNGAQTGLDIARMMLAGASAVEMSSPVMIRGTETLSDALAQFEAYLKRKNLNAADLTGVAADRRVSFPARPLKIDDWKNYVTT